MKKPVAAALVMLVLSLSACVKTTPLDNSSGGGTPSGDSNYHTVAFDSAGGSHVESQRVAHGEKAKKPTDPTKEGHNFGEWTYEGEPWSFNGYVVTEDMTLLATWSPNTYTLTLVNDQDGAGDISGAGSFVYGTDVTVTATPNTGFTFAGWVKEDGSVASTNATYTFPMGLDMTLHATWSGDVSWAITKPTTITFVHHFGQQYRNYLDRVIQSFQAIEPNVTVQQGYLGSLSELYRGFPAGDYPDLVIGYTSYFAEYRKADKVVQLDSFMNDPKYGFTEEEADNLAPFFEQEGTSYSKEGTWSVPWHGLTEAMYYDEDKVIGLDLSAYDASINNGQPLTKAYIESLTWDELFDHLAPAILEYNNDKDNPKKGTLLDANSSYYSVLSYDSQDNLFLTLAEQYGYGYSQTDQTTGQTSLLWNNANMKNLVKKFKAAKDAHYFGTYNTNGDYSSGLLSSNKALFGIGSTNGASTYHFDVDNPKNIAIAPIPQKTSGAKTVIKQGYSLCILDQTGAVNEKEAANRKLASWLFYKYLINNDNDLAWSTYSGSMPNRVSTYDSETYAQYADVSSKQAKSQERITAYLGNYYKNVYRNLFVSPAFTGSQECRTEVGELMRRCFGSSDLDANIDEFFQDAYNDAMNATMP